MTVTRISRPCYDKYHRCPGWAGSGMKFARVDRCEGGHVQSDPNERLWGWRFHRCDTCDLIVLPYHIRWLDASWLRWWIPFAIKNR